MKAVILVAGKSRRMGPLTDHIHKSLLEVAGRPILDRMLRALDHNALRNVVFVCGSMQDQLRGHVARAFPSLNVTRVENPDYASTNTAYSLSLADAAGESIGINLIAAVHLERLFATLAERIDTGAGRSEYYEHAFNRMVADGIPFRAVEITDLPVMEVDTPEDYHTVKQELSAQLLA
ncbi:MAG: N-acetylmuramate alpha-1-phosphate uridylyltransferase [Calditrichaeota bacterium]|nr:N-acetylmuramate alpha-1-phosphate uridylyltransferase [Calditrichota bacterium]